MGGQRNERRKWIHCLSEEHEILTDRGFLGVAAVRTRMLSGSVLVAGYDAVADQLVLQRPTQFVYHEPVLEGQTLFEFERADVGLSLVVSGGHDMYVMRVGGSSSGKLWKRVSSASVPLSLSCVCVCVCVCQKGCLKSRSAAKRSSAKSALIC